MIWFKKYFSKPSSEEQTLSQDQERPEFVWCLIGNIVEEAVYGEEKRIQRGTKHFRPGAKVYVLPRDSMYDEDYQPRIRVIALPRKSNRFITIYIDERHITNWRKKKVYKLSVIDKITVNNGWDDSADSERLIDEYLDQFEAAGLLVNR